MMQIDSANVMADLWISYYVGTESHFWKLKLHSPEQQESVVACPVSILFVINLSHVASLMRAALPMPILSWTIQT